MYQQLYLLDTISSTIKNKKQQKNYLSYKVVNYRVRQCGVYLHCCQPLPRAISSCKTETLYPSNNFPTLLSPVPDSYHSSFDFYSFILSGILYISRITHCLFCCCFRTGLFYLAKYSQGSFMCQPMSGSFFFFKRLNNIPLYRHVLHVHHLFSLRQCLSFSSLLAIMNCFVMNIGMQATLQETELKQRKASRCSGFPVITIVAIKKIIKKIKVKGERERKRQKRKHLVASVQ